ncbi:MAG: tyrosine-type recombinase/integrase [Deltaproteobacteria bacterium]|nr:tyrosine-type recombinase/integrase [Deltaproteobacteria bacterium]
MGVRKRGDKFYIDYYVGGQRVRESVGTSRREAEQALAARNAEVVAGTFRLPSVERTSFREAVDQYLDWSRDHKRTWDNDQCMLGKLLPYLGDMPLSQVTAWQIEEVKKVLRSQGLSGSRGNRYLATLSSLFHRAFDRGLVRENPVKRVKRFRESPGRLRYLDSEEIDRLLGSCGLDLRDAVICALGTGMRLGEIFSLRWRDLDFEAGFIHVVDSKNGERRDVPLSAAIAKALEGRKGRGGEWVFARPDGTTCKSFMRTAWDKARARAGLEDVRFHDLRHTFASHLVMGGASEFAVQQLLGHKCLAMTRRYSHLSGGALRQAVVVMDRLLPGGRDAAVTRRVGHKMGTVARRAVRSSSQRAKILSFAGVAERQTQGT